MIKIACADFPVGRKTYEAKLKTVELDQLFDGFPKMETVEKWKREAPEYFDFIVCASKIITHATKTRAQNSRPAKKNLLPLEDSAASRQALATTLKVAEMLKARLVFFELPSQFSPSPDNIRRVQKFFSKPRGHIMFAWQHPAHWPIKLVDDLSEEHRIMSVMNPLGVAKPTPNSPMRYYRLGANGRTSGNASLSDSDLKKIISLCDTPLCYVVFNNGPTSFQDAERMVSMLDPRSLP